MVTGFCRDVLIGYHLNTTSFHRTSTRSATGLTQIFYAVNYVLIYCTCTSLRRQNFIKLPFCTPAFSSGVQNPYTFITELASERCSGFGDLIALCCSCKCANKYLMDAKSRIGNKLAIYNTPFTLSTWHFSLDSITVKVCLANKPNVSTGSTRWTLCTVSSARLTGSQVMTFISSLDDIHILDEQWSSFQSSSRRWKVTTWVLSSYRKLLWITEGCEARLIARDHLNRNMKCMNK